jgi:tetratricopeptide (TPR) repeat protein
MGHQYGKSKAATLIEREEYAEALAAAAAAIEAEPENPEHWLDRATALAALDRNGEALRDFEEARVRDRVVQVLEDDLVDDAYFSALLAAARAEGDVGAGCALLDRYAGCFPEGRHGQDARDWQRRLRGELRSEFVKERLE